LLIRSRGSGIGKHTEYKFLFFNGIVLFAGAFIIDPRLGMARDWDLLSFAGVVPCVALLYLLLDRRIAIPARMTTYGLCVSLNLLILGPRVITQIVPDMAIAHFENYLRLDNTRSEFGYLILSNYHKAQGDPVAAGLAISRLDRLHPQFKMIKQAQYSAQNGDLANAERLANEVLDLNPLSWNAYQILAGCRLYRGDSDSALVLLEIGSTLNPYSPLIQEGLGLTYAALDRREEARLHLERAVKLDTTLTSAMGSLTSVLLLMGDIEASEKYLDQMGRSPHVLVDELRQSGKNYLNLEQFELAARAYQYALHRGMDSTVWNELQALHPELQQYSN
jgi:tetratricopeptide (TPR) repeat protein